MILLPSKLTQSPLTAANSHQYISEVLLYVIAACVSSNKRNSIERGYTQG